MIVFRIAHYDAGGALVRASEAFPTEAHHDPQTVAELSARAADAGCTYEAGTFLVWVDREVRPPARIEQSREAGGARSYGGAHHPIPTRS
jgi:hypothetical protein